MASSKIKGINIKIGADSRGLDTALKGIEAKSKSAQNELREINRTIKDTPNSLVAWKQKQEVLTKAIADSREKVKLLENAQEEVAKQLADGKINGEQYRAFQRELENARSESKKLDGQLQEVKQKIREFGKETEDTAKDTDKLGDSMEDAGKDAEKSSDGYTVLKGVLANLATQGINFAFDKLKIFTQQIIETGKTFEASMSNASAISGATGEEMDKLSEKAKQMGATTKYTASQAADAFGFMALAGWKTEDMLAGIDGVLSLAAASNMDLARASDIVTDYLTAFGLTAQDSAKFVDQMSYAMSNSNTTTEALGEAYKNCAATAASMGYSVEETTAVLMTMANAGVKGGEAGTALNAIMTRLATDTGECATKLKNFNVDIYNNKGEMCSLANILEGVSDVWTTLTDEQQANLAKSIAGVNHYSALQTIMNGLSDSAKESGMSFTDYAAALEECDGTAQNMANTMIDNLAGDMTILDSSIDGVKIALSEKLNPILRDLVQYITEKMPEIQESSEKAFDVVVVIAEWCKKNMPEIKKVASDLLPLITSIGTGIAGLTVATTAQSAIKGLTTTFQALNAAMAANPAAAVTVAVAALAAAIGVYYVQAETEVSKLQKIFDEVDRQYSKEHEQIDKTRESIKKVNEKFNDSAKAIDAEAERTEYLWKQLDNLVVKNGEVEESNKQRAKYILGELNQALGTEYELTGNQIEGYQNLRDEIDKTIAKKKAEAYLDAYFADASEMAKNKSETKSAYITASKQSDDAKETMETMESNFNAINSTDMTAAEIVDYYDKHGNVSLFESEEALERKYAEYYANGSKWKLTDSSKRFTREQLEAAQAYVKAKSEYVDATSRQAETKADYNEIMQYFDTYDKAYKAFTEAKTAEDYNSIENIVYNSQDRNQLILENATDWDEEIKNAYKERQTELSYTLKLALSAEVVNQDEIDDIFAEIGETAIKGLQSGATTDEVVTADMREVIQKAIAENLDISSLTKWGKDSGIKPEEFFDDVSKVLSEQINSENIENGYNVDDFLEWVAKSKTKIAKEAWDDVAIYINNQIKTIDGYDITPILKTIKEAGVDIKEAFGGDYMGIIQKQIDEGLDPTELINWFVDTDKEAAESFKKNYKELSQDMLDEGFDPTSMLKHFAETDKKFADDFKKNGKDVVQAMLDKGFDFTELIKGFDLAITDIFDIVDEKFRKKFQKTLGVSSNEPSFFEWGNKIRGNPNDRNDGMKVGYEDLIGENFEQYYDEYKYYLDAKNGRIHNNSAWDAKLDEERRRKVGLSKYATGGYISSGNKAIVAEAGPELLEVMNGGIRVTPLRGKSAGETVSGSESSPKNFYNTYNINNPRISGYNDIRTIAQELAAEQRRIERGRGI